MYRFSWVLISNGWELEGGTVEAEWYEDAIPKALAASGKQLDDAGRLHLRVHRTSRPAPMGHLMTPDEDPEILTVS